MNPTEIMHSMQQVTDLYIQELEAFDMDRLLQKPSEEEWSIGQMYQHLIQSALYMQLANIEACRKGAPEVIQPDAQMSEDGQAIFAHGSLPPIRIHVPASPQYTPKQPENKEQLHDGLRTVLRLMQELEPTLQDIPTHHKVAHPRFGPLNAQGWFALVEMHYRHHLHQLNRLKG